jgi:twitching motility protein PilU
MINTPHISELVKRGDVSGIKESIMLSGDQEVCSFDSALHKLYKDGRVSLDEALASADSRTNLEAKINLG